MKKKHKTGYRAGNDIKKPFPFPFPGEGKPGPKPPILWVKKNGKVVKATEEEIEMAKKRWIKGRPSTIKFLNVPVPKKIRIGSTKFITGKKGGKIK